MASSAERHGAFSKVLGTLDVLVVAFGAMIGWGWVVSTGQWITTGGVLGAVLGFVVGGTMIFLVGLTYSELTTAFPSTGGAQLFSRLAFGPVCSFVCAWALLLSYLGVVCFEAVSFPTILQYLYPRLSDCRLYSVAGFDVTLPWLAIAVLAAVGVTLTNVCGVRKAAVLQTVLTLTIAAVGILLLVGSLFSGSRETFSGQMFSGGGAVGVFKVAIVTPFFLFGFDVIPQAAEEINVPLKKLGKLMVLSIGFAVAFYAMVVVAVGFVLNRSEIIESMGLTGLVTADAMAKAFGSQMMARVLILGGLCGIVTSWNSFLLGGSRVLYAMAKERMVPTVFASLHSKYHTPFVALWLLGGLSVAAPFFGRVMLVWVVDAANFACCIAYGLVAASFLVLRKRQPDVIRPYRVYAGALVGWLAVLLALGMGILYLIPGTGCSFVPQERWIVVGWCLLGVLLAWRGRCVYFGACSENDDGKVG